MANSVDPDQNAPKGAVCSGSMLFASILNLSVMLVRQFFAADDFSRRHFQMHFFSWRLMVKVLEKIFFLFLNQYICCGYSKNRLNETVLLITQNIC